MCWSLAIFVIHQTRYYLCCCEVFQVCKTSRSSPNGNLLHLLRHLREDMYLGLKYYSDITVHPTPDCCHAIEFLWIICYALLLIYLGMMLIQVEAQDVS